MKTPTTWLGLWSQILSALAICTSCVAYVVRRIKAQKKEGEAWPEILADGAKPMTGRVWLDGAIVAFLFLGCFAAIAFAFSRL
jgi:hypothetical protein